MVVVKPGVGLVVVNCLQRLVGRNKLLECLGHIGV